MDMPLTAKLNSGGVGLTNSAEFGTNVTVASSAVVTSQAYVVAGDGELNINMDDQFRTSVQVGVANADVGQFAGLIARDPFSQVCIGNINFVQEPVYTVSVGAMNEYQVVNGLLADENTTRLQSGNSYVWDFTSVGDLTVPGQIRNAENNRAVWSNELPRDIADLTDNNMLLGVSNSTLDINIDGGGAYATYEGTLVRADGGFSGTRWGVHSTIYDGGLGAAGAGYTTTLNGGGA
jgi:hypothetical protein